MGFAALVVGALLLPFLPADPGGAVVHAPVLTLVAGTGAAGDDAGPGGVATGARFVSPVAVATPDGQLLVADAGTCRVQRVDHAGLVQQVAGTGVCGSEGDGGPASTAQLHHPGGLALATDGSVVVADTDNCTIRLISPAGVISRVAGRAGDPQPSCGFGGDTGPATNALLDHPAAVAVAGDGSLYIADTANCRVRRVDTAGVITTVAGSGTCGYAGDRARATNAHLDHPGGVAVDPAGRVHVADTGNHRVRRINGDNITTVAGTGAPGSGGDLGPATSAQLDAPVGVAFDAVGRLYVADRGSCRIRSVIGVTIATLAGSTCGNSGDRVPATVAQLGAVGGVSVTAGGDVVISDTGNHQVKVVDRAALADRSQASVSAPLDLGFDRLGNANTSPRNWSGGDATYSLRLPGGRVAWLFADSFSATSDPAAPGWVAPDHSRNPIPLVGNQLVIEDPTTTPPTFTTVWRSGAEGYDYFAPVDEFHRWWPFMPFLKNNTIMTVPLVSFDNRTGLVDATAVVDVSLLTMQPGPIQPTPGAFIDNPNEPSGCNAHIDFGDTVLVNPDGSGWTYVYGTEVCPAGALALHLARVPGRVLDRQRWEYFTGIDPGTGRPGWSVDPHDTARLRRSSGAEIDDGGYEYSVTPSAAGYRMVHHVSRYGAEIGAALAPAPWGPFGASTVIYRPPEQDQPAHANTIAGCGLVTYGAKEHREFTNQTEIVVSYNVNVAPLPGGGCTGWGPIIELMHNVDNYRPRFVRIPLVDGLPLAAT